MTLEHAIDSLLVVVLVLAFVCLGFRQVYRCIQAVALQGIVTGVLLLLVHADGLDPRIVGVAVVSMIVKGIAVPWLLVRSTNRIRIEQRVEPYIGFNLSMLLGTAAFGVALWLSSRLVIPHNEASDLIVPVSFATVFIGLLSLVSRRKAVTQVTAYLVLENGIFTFGLVLVSALPTIVEMGVLLDLFAAVFVMGVTIYQIGREFDHIDTSKLSALHDLTPRRRWRIAARGEGRRGAK